MTLKPRPGVPDTINQRMHAILEGVVLEIAPGHQSLVKPHIWRNVDYVGRSGDSIAVWRGWNANLKSVDPRYRSIYIDCVLKIDHVEENEALFGSLFAHILSQTQPLIFLYVTQCLYSQSSEVEASGFVYRRINRVIHPGVAFSVDQFFDTTTSQIIQRGVELIQLQHHLRN